MQIDVDQINRNRRLTADSTLETPWNTQIDDSDADFAEHAFDQMPADKVGLLPPTED